MSLERYENAITQIRRNRKRRKRCGGAGARVRVKARITWAGVSIICPQCAREWWTDETFLPSRHKQGPTAIVPLHFTRIE